MSNCLNCFRFNCISTTGNLIIIFIFNALGISLNAYKIHRSNYKKKISKSIPTLSTIEIVLNSISTINSILVFFTKNTMNKKVINRTITITSKILKYILVIFSLVNVFVLIKSFINFEGNNFLNSSNKYGNDSPDYTYDNRIKDLKKIKDILLEYHTDGEDNEEYFLVKDNSKFNYVNYSEVLEDYRVFDTDEIFGDHIYYVILYLLEELMNIFAALNWDSIETKTKKLIDTGIQSRFEDFGENENCITNLFLMMNGKKFYFCSVVISILNIVFIFIAFTFNKIGWLNNNITFDTWIFDVGIMTYYVIMLAFVYCCDKNNKNSGNNAKGCCSSLRNFIIYILVIIILLGAFYTNILSFFAVYYSYKGKTFIYYYCYDTLLNCQKLFQFELYYEYDPIPVDYSYIYYYYFKIFLSKGSIGILILALLMRLIMFIWVFTAIAKLLIFSNLIGPLKKVVYFIKNNDGTITDLDDINIEEDSQEKFSGNNAEGAEPNNEDNIKSKTIMLKQVIKQKKQEAIINNNVNYQINQGNNIYGNPNQGTPMIYNFNYSNNNGFNYLPTNSQNQNYAYYLNNYNGRMSNNEMLNLNLKQN